MLFFPHDHKSFSGETCHTGLPQVNSGCSDARSGLHLLLSLACGLLLPLSGHLMSNTSDKESINQPSLREDLLQEQSLSTQESNNTVPNCAAITQVPSKSTFHYEILPLLGNPYFISIMTKSHVQLPYQLVVPTRFHKALPFATVQGILSCRGKTWEIRYFGDCCLRRFSCGWRKFVEDNDLQMGDGCVFELMDGKELTFRVQILDGQIPAKLFKRGSSDRPIKID